MKYITKIFLCAVLGFVMVAPSTASAGGPVVPTPPSTSSLTIGSTGQPVLIVQFMLRSFGYAVPVSGKYDARTFRAVVNFQKVSRLVADGTVGPVTFQAIQIAVLVNQSVAQRMNPPVAVAVVVAAPQVQDFSTQCGKASHYRQQVGLPAVFDSLMQRESRCLNTVTSRTGCCVGALQINVGNFTAPGYRDGIAACGVFRRSDIMGEDDQSWRNQMCVVKVLYDVSGLQPWAL